MKWDVIPESLTLEIKGDRPVKRLMRVDEIRQGGICGSEVKQWV